MQTSDIRLENVERSGSKAKLRFEIQAQDVSLTVMVSVDAESFDAADWVIVARRKLHEHLAELADRTRAWGEESLETELTVYRGPRSLMPLTRERSRPTYCNEVMVRADGRLPD